MTKKKIYISGPMTDKKTGKVTETNLMAFHVAEQTIKREGYTDIVNPIHVWACRWPRFYRCITAVVGQTWAYRLVLLYDLWLLLRCTHIYKIPGWRESRGANIESCVAYHFKIWPLPAKRLEQIDKRVARIMSEKTNS